MKRDYEDWLQERCEEHDDAKEEIWRHAQFTLLKNLMQSLDDDIDGVFGRKNQVVLDKAVLVAYMSSLKNEYKLRKKLLEKFKGEMLD